MFRFVCCFIFSCYILCFVLLFCVLFFLMLPRPPRTTRTDTLFPYTTLSRSHAALHDAEQCIGVLQIVEGAARTRGPAQRQLHRIAGYLLGGDRKSTR